MSPDGEEAPYPLSGQGGYTGGTLTSLSGMQHIAQIIILQLKIADSKAYMCFLLHLDVLAHQNTSVSVFLTCSSKSNSILNTEAKNLPLACCPWVSCVSGRSGQSMV